MFRQSVLAPWRRAALSSAPASTQSFVPAPRADESKGFPITVSSVGSFPLALEVHRQDVLRFFHFGNLDPADIIVQYTAAFRPAQWWVRFHTKEDRDKALGIENPRWGGRRVMFEPKSLLEWKTGTFNHLVGMTLGSAVLVSRLASGTTKEDLNSFFRNFHLQGNGITVLEDPFRPNLGEQDQFKRAIVRFISKQEAQRAARALHRKYLRSNMVNLRVLQ